MNSAIVAAILAGVLAIVAAVIGALLTTEKIIITDLFRWRSRLPPGFLIFINGASGVGKTSVAWALARKYNIPSVFGSDLVREALRQVVTNAPTDQNSVLLASSFLAYTKLSVESLTSSESRVISGFRKQCEMMSGSLNRIINRIRNKQRDPVIIEGVNLIASQIFSWIPNDPYNKVLFINLYIDSEENHRLRIRERGVKSGEPADATDRYIQNLVSIIEIDRFLRDDSQALMRSANGLVSNVLSIENSGSISRTINRINKRIKEKCRFLERKHL